MLITRYFRIDCRVLKEYRGPGGDVAVPEGVTDIGEHAFSGCRRLTSVALPDSLKSIGEDAFSGCGSLKELRLPKGCGASWLAERDKTGQLLALIGADSPQAP